MPGSIPKIIHYCWFGRTKKPKQALKCIASWKKYCKDYQIIEWNEDNFDVNINSYTKMCYESKKYAFLSDYVRLLVVEKYGGIYFDTDVEVLRPFDDLLDSRAFFGFETPEYVDTGLGFGAEAGNSLLRQMLQEYDELPDGQLEMTGCPKLNTRALLKNGLKQNGKKQELGGTVIYPVEYFNPLVSTTGMLNKTENTYSIHWYSMSWIPWHKRLKSRITRYFHRFFGSDCFTWLKRW